MQKYSHTKITDPPPSVAHSVSFMEKKRHKPFDGERDTNDNTSFKYKDVLITGVFRP